MGLFFLSFRDKRAAAEQSLRDEIERLHNDFDELELESLIVEQERRIVLRRIYHEAPDDIMELIVKLFSDVDEDGWAGGGMNVLRLVGKRLMRVVESCATRLTQLKYNGPETLPLSLRRCQRIEHIRCDSRKLKSLEGCPDGLKSLDINGRLLESLEPLRGCSQLESLYIEYASQIADLSPLNACTRLKALNVDYSHVSDISVLSSVPLLEELELQKDEFHPSIKDLSPFAHCTQLEKLWVWGLTKLTYIKPLSSLAKLQCLYMISDVPVKDLTPLSALLDLEEIDCVDIPLTTSLLPLARCSKLKRLYCNKSSKDLDLLKERRPDLEM